MRTWLVRTLVLAAVVIGLRHAYTQEQAPPLELEQVRGPLHVLKGSGGNVGVLVGEEGVLLVDDKFDRNVPEILAKVASLTDKPVRYIINTHHHGDHSGGNQALFEGSAVGLAHENARENLVRNSQPGAPPITFSEEAAIHLGEQRVQAFHFGRGHTSGDTIVYFPQLGVIHTGDLFVRGAPFIDYDNGGSAIEWDDTLNGALQLEFDTIIPGHGDVATREDLAEWKDNFEEYRNRISDLAREGKTAEQVAASIDLSDLDGWSIGRLQTRSLPGLLRELR